MTDREEDETWQDQDAEEENKWILSLTA